MLLLTRGEGDKVFLDIPDPAKLAPNTRITVSTTDIGSGRCRLGFDAPKEVRVVRAEIAGKTREGEAPCSTCLESGYVPLNGTVRKCPDCRGFRTVPAA